jgi:hypothetical protein
VQVNAEVALGGGQCREVSGIALWVLRGKERAVVAPRFGWPGSRAGHVLLLEKGSRAVKGLQRHRAGGTMRWGSAEGGGTYLREWSGSQKGRAEDGRDGGVCG